MASSSPRRKDLLASLGVSFEIISPDIAEEDRQEESHEEYVARLALMKASAVAFGHKDAVVIGADTIVAVDKTRLSKPRGREDARRMLGLLSGRSHHVFTGIALVGIGLKIREVSWDRSRVAFRSLAAEEIERYISSPEPYDKAGGYGIQGAAASFIETIEGERDNVIGLPMKTVKALLIRNGLASLLHPVFPLRSSTDREG